MQRFQCCAVGVLVLLAAGIGNAQPSSGKLVVKETLLGTAPIPGTTNTTTVYPRMTSPRPTTGPASQLEGEWPKPIPVPAAWVSPDWKNIACLCTDAAGQKHMVINGVPGKGYAQIQDSSIRWSPDSSKLAFVATEGGQSVMVVNGQEQGRYPQIFPANFSPDGSRMAFAASGADGAKVLVIDGQVTPFRPDEIFGGVWFSPDSRHVAYSVRSLGGPRPGASRVVVDGVSFAQSDACNLAAFSPDSRQFFFELPMDPDHSCIVEDGKLQRRPGRLPIFSPDGKRSAYILREESRSPLVPTSWIPVVDGARGKPYVTLSDFAFSPDSKHYFFKTRTPPGSTFVIDGQPGPQGLSDLTELVFSPDGQHFAYSAVTNRGCVAILDHRIVAETGQFLALPRFSKDGRWIEIGRSSGGKLELFVIGLDGAPWPEGQPWYKAFPRRFAAEIVMKEDREALWVAGQTHAAYDAFFADRSTDKTSVEDVRRRARLLVIGDNTVRTFALRAGRLIAVEATFEWPD